MIVLLIILVLGIIKSIEKIRTNIVFDEVNKGIECLLKKRGYNTSGKINVDQGDFYSSFTEELNPIGLLLLINQFSDKNIKQQLLNKYNKFAKSI